MDVGVGDGDRGLILDRRCCACGRAFHEINIVEGVFLVVVPFPANGDLLVVVGQKVPIPLSVLLALEDDEFHAKSFCV